MEACPLCSGQSVHHYHSDKKRDYLQCERCELVFVPREQRLDAVSEKAHYDLHNNDPQDQGTDAFCLDWQTQFCSELRLVQKD